jgi:hypothetical protein
VGKYQRKRERERERKSVICLIFRSSILPESVSSSLCVARGRAAASMGSCREFAAGHHLCHSCCKVKECGGFFFLISFFFCSTKPSVGPFRSGLERLLSLVAAPLHRIWGESEAVRVWRRAIRTPGTIRSCTLFFFLKNNEKRWWLGCRLVVATSSAL